MSAKNGKVINCNFCGKEKYLSGYHLGDVNYCSKECYFKSQANPPREICCLNCDLVFKDYNYQKERKYCSQKCAKEDYAKNHQGSRSWLYRGGLTEPNTIIRGSYKYAAWRKAVFERDNYTCQCCGKRGSQDIQADHIKPFSKYPESRFDVSNGRTLCVPCHRKTDTYGFRSLYV